MWRIMIFSNILWVVILLLTAANHFDLTQGLTCPGPVEEGSIVSLTCRLDSVTTVLVWQLEVSGQYQELSNCQVNQGCTNFMTPAFNATLDLSATDTTQHESKLTIARVNRNQTKFRCLKDVCQLEVYVKPETPKCVQVASLGHYGKPYRSFLEMTCSTDSSYPKAICTLGSSLSRDLVTRASPMYTYTLLEGGNYKTSCTYAIPLTGFQTGLHTFSLVFAANLSTRVPNAEASVQPEMSVNIFAPAISLGSDCPQGIIQAGVSATCTCKMTIAGYPQGWATWYTSSNRTTGEFKNDYTTLILTYNPRNPCPTFECSPESALGRLTPGITYVPNFEESTTACISINPSSQEDPTDRYLIIGISVAVCFVLMTLILGAIVFFLVKRRWKKLQGIVKSDDKASASTHVTSCPTYLTLGSLRSIDSGVSNMTYDQVSLADIKHSSIRTINSPVPRPSKTTASNEVYLGSVADSIRSPPENNNHYD